MSKHLLLSVTIFTGIFVSCKSTHIEKPVESYTSDAYKPTVSNINIPVSISQSALTDKLNKQIDGLLYADTSFEGDNMMVKVWKIQPISVQLAGSTLSYRVPLKIWVNAGISKWGFTVQKDMNITPALKFKTNINIQPDWSMKTTTTADSYEWLEEPYIQVAGLNIPIKGMVSRTIDKLQPSICSEIDKLASQYVDIKSLVEPVWAQLQKPLLLNKQYHLWLKLKPTEVSLAPFKNENGQFNTSIGLQTLSEIFINDSLNTNNISVNKTPLPTFKMLDKPSNGFNIRIGIDFPYTLAEKYAVENIQGKTFSDGKKMVTVNDVKLYGSADLIVVSALLSGSFNGKVYLTGAPVYNAVKQTIELSKLDFSLDTKSKLLRSAAWLFHSGIATKIAESAKFPINKYLNDAKMTANKSLENNTSLKNIVIKGEISTIDVDRIHLNPDGFKIIGVAEGKLDLQLKGLDF